MPPLTALQSLAVTASAIVATITLVVAVLDRLRNQRRERVEDWQRVIVQKAMQTAIEPLSLDQILRRYRTEATAFATYSIKPDELSSDALRKVLIDLIDKGAILQRGEDKYALNTPAAIESASTFPALMERSSSAMQQRMLDSMAPMMAAALEQTTQDKVKRAVFRTVGDTPFARTLPDLANHIAKECGVQFDDAKSKIVELLSDKKLIVDDSQRVGISPIANIISQ
jgi:hypothetical protein